MKKELLPRKKPVPTDDNHWIYGKHASLAALGNPRRNIKHILVNRNMHNEVPHLENFKANVQIVDNKAIENVLPAGSIHQGIAVQTTPLTEMSMDEFCRKSVKSTEPSIVLLLDQVTDPHNVGAILRSAAAFGVEAVITTSHNSPQETGTLAKSASGSLELVPFIRVTNLVSAMDELKACQYWILGLDGYAEKTLDTTTSYTKTALVLGSEEKGMRRLTKEHCDVLVKLPIDSKVESLNVSNAAAISLYALSRHSARNPT